MSGVESRVHNRRGKQNKNRVDRPGLLLRGRRYKLNHTQTGANAHAVLAERQTQFQRYGPRFQRSNARYPEVQRSNVIYPEVPLRLNKIIGNQAQDTHMYH